MGIVIEIFMNYSGKLSPSYITAQNYEKNAPIPSLGTYRHYAILRMVGCVSLATYVYRILALALRGALHLGKGGESRILRGF